MTGAVKGRARVLFLCTGNSARSQLAQPKHLSELAGRRFDYVISLCDKVREVRPEFPGAPEAIHWSIPSPPDYQALRSVAADLRIRIGFLLARISNAAR